MKWRFTVLTAFCSFALFTAGWWFGSRTSSLEKPSTSPLPNRDTIQQPERSPTDKERQIAKLEGDLKSAMRDLAEQRHIVRDHALTDDVRSVDELLMLLPSEFLEGNWSPAETEFEDCWFEAVDGLRIHGWYLKHEAPKVVVLYAHGNAGNVTHRAAIAAHLHNRFDVSILLFDYRGYGRSEGTPTADNLRGTVTDTRSNPVAGARIDIATAAPKAGPGLFCPSCYLDCAKSTKSDEQGHFEFVSLDPTLKFRLLATAPDMQTASTNLLDPALDYASITLLDFPTDTPQDRILQGRVVSAQGVAVSGALVGPCGAKNASRRWGGRVNGASAAVTDDDGHFRMLLTEDLLAIDVKVTAHGYPGTLAELLPPGESLHRITVPSGTTVTGQLLLQGQPQLGLPGISSKFPSIGSVAAGPASMRGASDRHASVGRAWYTKAGRPRGEKRNAGSSHESHRLGEWLFDH